MELQARGNAKKTWEKARWKSMNDERDVFPWTRNQQNAKVRSMSSSHDHVSGYTGVLERRACFRARASRFACGFPVYRIKYVRFVGATRGCLSRWELKST